MVGPRKSRSDSAVRSVRSTATRSTVIVDVFALVISRSQSIRRADGVKRALAAAQAITGPTHQTSARHDDRVVEREPSAAAR